MKINRIDDSNYVIEINQEELNELRNGLGWSYSEGCHIDETINRTLNGQLKEYET